MQSADFKRRLALVLQVGITLALGFMIAGLVATFIWPSYAQLLFAIGTLVFLATPIMRSVVAAVNFKQLGDFRYMWLVITGILLVGVSILISILF